MKLEPEEVCDLYYPDKPSLARDDVQPVEVIVKVGRGIEWSFGLNNSDDESLNKVLCKRARERLFTGLERLTRPPAKRKKEPNGQAP